MPHYYVDRCALKPEHSPDLILDISLIGKMEQPRVVNEDDKRGRFRPGLSHVIQLEPPSFVRGGLHPRRGVREDVIELTCRYAQIALLLDEFYELNTSISPAIIVPAEGEEKFVYMVLPVRLK